VHVAQAPRVRDHLMAEIDAGEDDAYLTATIQEVQRLRPVVPTAEPRLTKKRVRIGGIEYPPGVALMPSPFLVHHDPTIYPDPFSFRPERFLHATPSSYTFIPFGGGRRRCVGAAFAQLEMKIVLSRVLRRFTVDAAGRRPERTIRRSVTFSPSNGASVILHERPRNGYQSRSGRAGAGETLRPLSAAASGAGDPAGGS
jgi:cytochrome P450